MLKELFKTIAISIIIFFFQAIAFLSFHVTFTNPELTLSVLSSDKVEEIKSDFDNATLIYNGKPIDVLYRTRFTLINTGGVPINESKIEDPIAISMQNEIFDAYIEYKYPENIKSELILDNTKNKITIFVKLLNPKDEIIFLILTPKQIESIIIHSRIEGIKDFNKKIRIFPEEWNIATLIVKFISIPLIVILILKFIALRRCWNDEYYKKIHHECISKLEIRTRLLKEEFTAILDATLWHTRDMKSSIKIYNLINEMDEDDFYKMDSQEYIKRLVIRGINQERYIILFNFFAVGILLMLSSFIAYFFLVDIWSLLKRGIKFLLF